MNPEYLFAGESCRDLQLRSYNISYFRIDRNYIPMHRYVAPEAEMMIAVIGFNDRNTINQALLYRFIISYEPRNFKGHLDEFPLTVNYGSMVDALRKKYSNYLWDAEFMDTDEAKVTVSHNEPVNYSVFKNPKTGKRAVVVSNKSYEKTVSVTIELERHLGKFLVVRPESPEPISSNGKVELKALSAVVFMEE